MPTYDSLLRVRNFDLNTRQEFQYANQKFLVPPAKKSGKDVIPGEAYVSFDAVRLKMGDPRTGLSEGVIRNDDGTVSVRTEARSKELWRLHNLYGTYSEDHDILKERAPKIKAWNMDDDPDESDPIIFPVDDPYCQQFAPEETDQSQMAIMQRQLDKLRRTQLLLEQQLAATQSGRQVVSDETVDEDDGEIHPPKS